MKRLTITIEGEQGSGKTTAARIIAQALAAHAGLRVVVRDGEGFEEYEERPAEPKPTQGEALVEVRQGGSTR